MSEFKTAKPKDEEIDNAPEKSDEKSEAWDLIEDRRFQLTKKAAATRKHLLSQPLVKTMIPRAENEAKDATQYYNVNGFAFYIRKGVFQNVPADIAELISDTYGQDARIMAEHPLNLNNNKAAAAEFARG